MALHLLSRQCPRCTLQRCCGPVLADSLRSPPTPSTSTLSPSGMSSFAASLRPLSTTRARPLFLSRTLAIPSAASQPPPTSSSSSSDHPPERASTPQTHYDLFPSTLPAGPPPRGPFTIDMSALRSEFRRLQAGIHPDTQPPHLRRIAEGASSRLNEAFRTLASPLHRAQYLLALRGVDVAGDERARVDDAEMLMQVMEAREAIEDAVGEADLDATKKENEARIADSMRALEEAFRVEDVERAKREAVRLRYWTNIAEALQNWEQGKGTTLVH